MSESVMRRDVLMPDDVEWLKDGIERLEQSLRDGLEMVRDELNNSNAKVNKKLDDLPCMAHMTELASVKQQVTGVKQQINDHAEGHKQGWTKGAVIVSVIAAIITLAALVVAIYATTR
jgi:hypothetical protein